MENQNQNQRAQLEQLAGGTTLLRTCFNGINALTGVGILSIPFALAQGGWLSLSLLFLVAILCWYTGLLLHRCMNARPNVKTYPDIGQLAFGYKGRVLICIFMYLELYLVAVEFLILEGDNLNKLFPDAGFKLGSLNIRGKQMFVLLTALIILPTTWLKNLGVLAYVSFGGVLASIILVVCVFWIGAIDNVGFHERGVLLDWKELPTTISLYSFCYCGHAMFPALCHSMKDRSKFSKVLLICFITSTINYGSMAILGYLMYGENIKSQVTLNLPTRKISTQIAIYTTLINPITKYAIYVNPIAEAIENTCPFPTRRPINILIRSVILITTIIVALTIPFFAYVMAFIGAFLSIAVSILFPCFCYLKINEAARNSKIQRIIISSIGIIGALVAVVGTYSSVKQITDHIRS